MSSRAKCESFILGAREKTGQMECGLYREGKIVDPLPGLVWTLRPGARARDA